MKSDRADDFIPNDCQFPVLAEVRVEGGMGAAKSVAADEFLEA
ncbi:MAG TPA: hypothetical protein VNU95_08585 [Candidatus Acidoferrales bacterium]|nr:hypothetical protein [Candidatus Acidoferrales bacterium]